MVHIKLEDINWFDKRYAEGGKPSLRDRFHLCKTLEIPLTGRAERIIENLIKEALYMTENDNGDNRRALLTLSHQLVTGLAPFCSAIDENRQKEYIKKLDYLMNKYRDEVGMNFNFSTDEANSR